MTTTRREQPSSVDDAHASRSDERAARAAERAAAREARAAARAAKAQSRDGVRPEIQALRALAVTLVVVFHFWPDTLPGGFAGVDVFFAVSGFLITSHLVREVRREGSISLPRFWARRARRLLPAALLTLLVCAIATILIVPESYWEDFLGDIAASTAYIQNWNLADKAVDYHAQTDATSPSKHFWSLSAEEQFYIVWPLLLLIPALFMRATGRGVRMWPIAVALLAVTVGSFVVSLSMTSSDPSRAFFVTPTRAWEFGLGGLLAIVAPTARGPAPLRAVISWAGIAAILITGVAMSGDTPWPGMAALVPVLGALAVIYAGMPDTRWAPSALLRVRPAQETGDLSYAIYLWHWPLLILAPYLVGELTGAWLWALLVLTVLVAWFSKVTVEDPLRSGRLVTRLKPIPTLGFAAVATACVIAVPLAASSHVRDTIRADEAEAAAILKAKPRCFGAAVRDPARPDCRRHNAGTKVVPTPAAAAAQPNAPCDRGQTKAQVNICSFGSPKAKSKRTIALIGDSHASHWRAALAVVARQRSWHGISITHTGCAFSRAYKKAPEPEYSKCVRWTKAVPKWLARHSEVGIVFTSGIAGGKVPPKPGLSSFQTEVRGFRAAWRTLPKSVEHVIVLRDVPKMRGDTLGCVEKAMKAGRRASGCDQPRGRAMVPDAAAQAVNQTGSRRFQAIDLTDIMCTARTCNAVIGGALVHKDVHHLSRVFATTLGPILAQRTSKLVKSWAEG